MGMPKHAARRDLNEPELIAAAKTLGWMLWKMHEPADWLALRQGRFYVVEIKNPDCEGHRDEFTGQQLIFHRDVKNAGGEVLVWRRVDDILRDTRANSLGARLSQ
jgi:hypothetical protein